MSRTYQQCSKHMFSNTMKQEGNEKELLGCIDQTTSSKLYGLIMNISKTIP
jgi:hypothetical protein